MVATDFEIKFAQSRVDYFEKVLKKGEGDGLKTLLRAIEAEGGNDYSAAGIATAIKASKVILQKDKDAAVTKAAQLTKAANAMTVVTGVTAKDIQDAKDAALKATNAADAMTVVTGVTAKDIQDAKDAALKATNDANAMTVVTGVTAKDIQDAKDAALKATNDADAMTVVTGVTAKDIQDAKDAALKATNDANAMTVVTGVTAKDIQDAKDAALKATNDANAMTVVTGVTAKDIQDAKDAALKATNDANAMTVVTGVTQADIDTAVQNAQKATTDANAIKVGDDPVLTAAKALLGDDTVTKIKAETDAAKLTTLYTDKAPDFMKNYGFINAILKNIPNLGKDVLKSDADAKTFIAYANDTLKDDALKAANAYFKIVATACGTGPFETTDLPEKDANSHHVKNCLDQANKVAYALLTNVNCGKDTLDSGSVKADCLKAVANMAPDLYNDGNFDVMNTDLSGVYPYDKVFSELDAIAV